jgi:hypothetical protein
MEMPPYRRAQTCSANNLRHACFRDNYGQRLFIILVMSMTLPTKGSSVTISMSRKVGPKGGNEAWAPHSEQWPGLCGSDSRFRPVQRSYVLFHSVSIEN